MTTEPTAVIFDIQRNSFVDGPGIRTTVFFKGCNLRCLWCHNPESQQADVQMMRYEDKCKGCGACERVCPNRLNECALCGKCTLYCPVEARKLCGKEYTPEQVLAEVVKDKCFYDNSGGGVTFSGGECMLQPDFLREILKRCKESGIHTAVDTAGHVPFERFEAIMPFVDLFLYDVKLFDSDKHREYVGVGNELILQNLKKLLAAGAKVWIRIPIVPGVNDSEEELRAIKGFLDEAGKPEKTELLPYHAMGENKYRAIGREVRHFREPDKEQMNRFKAIFA